MGRSSFFTALQRFSTLADLFTAHHFAQTTSCAPSTSGSRSATDADHGALPRFVAIFSYVAQPGMVGSPERTRQLYGRVLPVHIERAGLRADALVD